MKKILTAVFLVMFATLLVACGDKGGKKDNRIVLSYAAWNLGTEEENNIERRMIKAFEETHPEYRIDLVNRPKKIDENGNEVDATWNELFNNLASVGKMPDIFQVSSVVDAIVNGWAQDVSHLVLEDEDFNNVPQDITDSARYGGKLFALPQAMFYFGYFINRTAIQDTGQGHKEVTYGMEYEEFMAAAKSNYKLANLGGDGILGINGMNSLVNWLPAQYDESLGWFAYNEEEGYQLNSDAFIRAVEEQKKYYASNSEALYPYVAEAISDEFKALHYGEASPWHEGRQSMIFEGSYNLRGFLQAAQEVDDPSRRPDIDFVGTPKVGDVHRIPVVLDYIGVGRGTKHEAIAYEFAKWMGFGKDGYQKRLEIASNNPEAGAVNFAPIVQDEELLDEYFALYPTLVEFEKIVRNHQSFIIESIGKTVPGYWISRGSARYNETYSLGEVLDLMIKPDKDKDSFSITISEHADNLKKAADAAYTDAKKKLDEALAALK